MIGDALATALERAGLPKGVLSVVHDDGEDALRAALQSGAASYVRASGYPNRIRRLERLAAGGNGAEFGSGLSRSSTAAPGPALEMRILRSKTAVVRSAEDPAARAAEIVEGAFGRSASLSGQLPGQIGRVACSDRSFSKFTELLLAELRKSPDVSRPAPIVERESEDRLRRVRVLGLDEGATLIFDGEDVDGGEQLIKEGAGETAPAASPRSQADAMLAPMVFTNVEERMRLTLLGRPLPLLCLLRVHDDAQGQALAERLDRDVPAEDLTLDAPT
jgi:acyl-CoA reductase-like NAD-dependent aldehyde dehydrogenase